MTPSGLRRQAGPWLLGFFGVNSAAENVQAVAMMFATYALTHDAAAVGAVNAAAYLPGVVIGLLVRRRADTGHAARRLSMTNWVLFLASTALTLVWLSGAGHDVVLGTFAVVQVALSVVKTFNKAYVGRFVRERFANRDAVRLLERATSVGLVGGLVGGAASGVALDGGATGWCFAGAAALYLLSMVAVRRAAGAAGAEGDPGTVPEAAGAAPGAARGTETVPAAAPVASGTGTGQAVAVAPAVQADGGRRRALRMVLAFSVPSSGAMPFLSTLMVPLAAGVAPGSGLFYSVLSVSATCGGFVAGLLLSGGRVTMSATLGGALALACPLMAGLAVVGWGPAVVLLVFLAAMVVTAHIMAMQVLTNQAPAEGEVGRFTLMRNSVAGAAKAGFSLLAGWVTDLAGLGTAWWVLAATLAAFAVAWRLLGGRLVVKGLDGVD